MAVIVMCLSNLVILRVLSIYPAYNMGMHIEKSKHETTSINLLKSFEFLLKAQEYPFE